MREGTSSNNERHNVIKLKALVLYATLCSGSPVFNLAGQNQIKYTLNRNLSSGFCSIFKIYSIVSCLTLLKRRRRWWRRRKGDFMPLLGYPIVQHLVFVAKFGVSI